MNDAIIPEGTLALPPYEIRIPELERLREENARLRAALEYITQDFDPDECLGPPCGPEALKIALAALQTSTGDKVDAE